MKSRSKMLSFLVVLLGAALSAVEGFKQELSCGKRFYRTVHLSRDESTLYVGAMDAIYALDAANVSASDCEASSLNLPASNAANCVSKGKTEEFDCRNHIRVIQPIGRDGKRLYICGTNAHSPKDHVIYANLTKLARHEFYPGVGDGIAKCPFDPSDNSTALWVESGNPGGHPAIYSGTNAEFTKADTVIFRGDIFDVNTGRREYTFKRTIKYDSHMLDKPDFVGSYDIGDYVYFFFRETAVEFMNCGKTVYSRVARVCKRDVGGKNILHQNWATYLKARLNCSIPGEFPFFFNEIQSVYKSPEDDSVFHAIFTTSQNGLTGSAICSFNLKDVETTFEGKFKEQATTTSVWLPVPSAKVPTPRPGKCVDDTRKLSDTVLNFIRKHPLMDNDVPHDSDGPVFYQRDVMFTTLAVDSVPDGSFASNQVFAVYYVGTEDGSVLKISRWTDQNTGKTRSQLLDRISVSNIPIRTLTLSKKQKTLYVTTDDSIQQVSLDGLCAARYETCVQCTRDPYCGWERQTGQCKPKRFSLLSDPSGQARGMCQTSTPSQKIGANFGQSVHLSCPFTHRQQDANVIWYHFDSSDRQRKVNFLQSDKYVQTQDNGLVVLGTKERDSGIYECRLGTEPLARYHLTVDAHRCAAPNKTADYQKVYSEWCQEFQKYKSALKTWEKRQNKCASGSAQNLLEGYQTSPLV